MASRGAFWRWGTRRFWIDETSNAMIALSARYVAAMGHSNLFVWRREDGELLRAFPGFVRPAQAWFDDQLGRLHLRANAAESRLSIYDIHTGETSTRDTTEGDPAPVLITRDRSGYQLKIFWPEHPPLSLHYPNESIGSASVSPQVGRLAVPHGRVVDVLDRGGECLRSFRGFSMAALAPDGLSVALLDLAASRVVFGDVESGVVSGLDDPSGRVEQLAFSPDGSRLLVQAGGSVWLLDAKHRSTAARLVGCPSPRVVSVDAIDPWLQWTLDGAHLVGSAGHQLVRWNAHSGAIEHLLAQDPRLRVEVFSADRQGKRVATISFCYPGGLMAIPPTAAIVWDIEQAREVARIPLTGELNSRVFLAPDGKTLALDDLEQVHLFKLPELPGEATVELGSVLSAQWNGFLSDGLFARWMDDGLSVNFLRAGHVETSRTFSLAQSFAKSADQRRFAVGFADGGVLVYRSQGVEEIARFQASGRVRVLAMTPDGGGLVAGGWDSTAEGFDLDAPWRVRFSGREEGDPG